MFANFFITVIIISFAAFLYGIRHLFIEVEENACRMTYMFGVPQFSKVNFVGNEKFPNYELYYYYEGRLEKNINNLVLNGAPVIFVPGNAGSYKQVRSLASVALRKSMDNEEGIHLDYFTINYKDQLSGLYGGYLANQKEFLLLSIIAVRNLYKKINSIEKNLILIGHSMGGKVAEAALENSKISAFVNSIIFISTPIDYPVVNFDTEMNQFYTWSNTYLSSRKTSFVPNIETNVCTNYQHRVPLQGNESRALDNTLMISIGGGNRDLLVRDGLTISKYSDIHAMTSSIPRVWLSCDHLSVVWCLQLVMVINRFLFEITQIDGNKNVFFINDKTQRTQSAINFFVKPKRKYKSNEVFFSKLNDYSTWNEVSKITYKRVFTDGLRRGYNHMLPISKYMPYKKLYVEIESYEEINEWIYGCTANVNNSNSDVNCNKGSTLSHHIQSISSQDNIRNMVLIDLQHIRKFYSLWTHVLLRIPPTNKPVILKTDAFKNKERTLNIKAPRWFSLNEKILINETVYGKIYYEIFIEDIVEPFPTLQFKIEAIGCHDKDYDVVTKICIPWARGFERSKHITHKTTDKSVYVNVPISAPSHYNTTRNPLSLELLLDPVCRYKISYKFSIAGTTSKIVQEFYHWIPAHLTAVLFVVLRNQIVKFQKIESSVFIQPYAGYFQCKSIYILASCRLLKKLLRQIKFLPEISTVDYAFYVSIIIHSTAVVSSIIFVFTIWTILTLHGDILHKIANRLTTISPASSNVLMLLISTLPLTFGVLFISVAFATCSGIALVLAAVFYFIMISNAYKDYLENWAWSRATGLFSKLHSKLNKSNETDFTKSLVSDAVDKKEDSKSDLQGREIFSFHISMLLLLIIMSCLNFGVSVAWIKSQYFGRVEEILPDPFLLPTILVLCCLSILLQLNAPHKSSSNHVVAVILYISACLCLVYCEDKLYRLNFLIAFVYIVIALQEIGLRLLISVGFKF